MGIDVQRTLLHWAAYSAEARNLLRLSTATCNRCASATWPPLSECTRLTTLRYIVSTTSSFLTRSQRLHAILLSQS